MSASESHALDAVAFQLVAALERYDRDAARMIVAWPNLELYGEVSEQIERIRMYSNALPETRVQWVALLIAHSELVHFLWRREYGRFEAVPKDIGEVRAHHADCVLALKARCQRVIRTRAPHP